MKRFLVVGNPVAHSLSPAIHRAFAARAGLSLSYETACLPPDSFAAGLSRLWREQRLSGVNVTVPFKRDALAFCADSSPRARAAGAVNTISFDADGAARGDNTDGVGFIADVRHRCRLDPAGLRVLVLGAGGAARGLLAALRELAGVTIVIANRTPEKARALAAEFGVESDTLAGVSGGGFDLVVNATSASVTGQAPEVAAGVFADCRLAYDLFYSPTPTGFMRLAERGGCPLVVDGLGMLIEQAAESFAIWHGQRPDTEGLLESLRASVI